jgi:hypothetical protein
VALVLRIATVIATWYPALVPALVYVNWIVAWVELERCPRPMFDDPKHVGTLTPLVHWFSVWGVVLGFWLFWGAVAFLVIALVLPKQPDRKRLARRVVLSLLGIAAVYGWVRLDPGRVFEWYMD